MHIHELSNFLDLNYRIFSCQKTDCITHKKLQLDAEKKRVLLRPLNQDNDVIAL